MQARFTNAWDHEITWKHKKSIDKTKNGENVPNLGLFEVLLIQCNLVDSQYQQKFEVLFCMLNKSYVHLLNVETSNLVFLSLIKLS